MLLTLGTVALSGAAPVQAIEPPDCPQAQALCLEAERDGGIDMKTGTAFLEGNVVGLLTQHDLRFRSEVLRAYRNEADAWSRLELDQAVELEQPGRRATSAFAVIENASGEAELQGEAVLEEPFTRVEGEKVRLERNPQLSIVTGIAGNRARLQYEGLVPAGEYDPADPPGQAPAAAPTETNPAAANAPAGAPEGAAVPAGERMLPDTLVAYADRAELVQALGEARFRGNVEMHRLEMGWNLWGDRVDLHFTEDRRLVAFEADGNVRIEQPGRVLTADHAESRNEMETLLLTGNARALQQGQFDLNSDRIEVYTDVGQGLVQSGDRQQPIRLTLDLTGKTVHRLTPAGVSVLRQRGLPEPTLEKLEPLVGTAFPDRPAFLEALRPRLSAAEASLYQEAIIDAAR